MSDPLTILEEPRSAPAISSWRSPAGTMRPSRRRAPRYLGQIWPARSFATSIPGFYHFGLSRPYVRFKTGSRSEREIVWPSTEVSPSQPEALDRDLIVGVAVEPHLKWRTYCGAVLDLAQRARASLVLTLGALLAEVPHTRPVKLVGGAHDPELSARLGIRPTRYEGPTGIVGVLNTLCRERGVPTASLWANVPHYISGIENPKASMALVRRVLSLLNAEADLSDLEEAARQFDHNLEEIVSQNGKIAEYVTKLERKSSDEDGRTCPAGRVHDGSVLGGSRGRDRAVLPPAAPRDLVARIAQPGIRALRGTSRPTALGPRGLLPCDAARSPDRPLGRSPTSPPRHALRPCGGSVGERACRGGGCDGSSGSGGEASRTRTARLNRPMGAGAATLLLLGVLLFGGSRRQRRGSRGSARAASGRRGRRLPGGRTGAPPDRETWGALAGLSVRRGHADRRHRLEARPGRRRGAASWIRGAAAPWQRDVTTRKFPRPATHPPAHGRPRPRNHRAQSVGPAEFVRDGDTGAAVRSFTRPVGGKAGRGSARSIINGRRDCRTRGSTSRRARRSVAANRGRVALVATSSSRAASWRWT